MKKKIITVTLLMILLTTSFSVLPGIYGATEEEIETSVALGVTWLASKQNTDGSWGTAYKVARTGMAVLKLIDRAHDLGMEWTDSEYAYKTHIEDGLNYLFSQAIVVNPPVQTYGDPDANSNDKAVYYVPPSSTINYQSAIALMAIGATNTPSLIVNKTGSVVDGWAYAQVVQDSLDFFAYSQSEAVPWRGGWGYAINAVGTADNSVSGYVALAIGYAKNHDASIVLPQYVLDELEVWISAIQAPAGYSYYRPSGLMTYGDLLLKTGNLLYEMALVGYPIEHAKVQLALNYVESNWGMYDYQRAYCLMKGLEAYDIDDEITVGSTGDWFDDMSTWIIGRQQVDGSFLPRDPHDYYSPYVLTSAWALLTLERATAPPAPQDLDVYVDIKPGSWPNPINVDKNGVTSVAICGTEDFDVTEIDPASLLMYKTGEEDGVAPIRWSYEDAATPYDDETPDDPDGHELTGDGYVDLVLKFDTPELVSGLSLGDDVGETIYLTLKGHLHPEEGEEEGKALKGGDWVRVQESKGKGKGK